MQHCLDAAKGQLNDFVANFRVLADKFDGRSGLGVSHVKNNAALLCVCERE